VAAGLPEPVGLAFGPDGRLYVALRQGGRVVSLAQPAEAGAAVETTTVIAGLSGPSDVAFRGDELWIVDSRRLVRARLPFDGGESRLPDITLDSLAFSATSIAFVPGLGGPLVAVAETCDGCGEGEPRQGAILHVGAGTSASYVWATGFRHVGALAVQPVIGAVWATETGRSDLGRGLPVDELNAVHRGRHYGWPYCFGYRVPAPEYADPARCDRTEPPAIAFPAASVPSGIAFYTGDAFPPDYHGDAFVVLAGAASPLSRSAARVVRVRFVDGRPVGVESFISGWLERGGSTGRPARLAVGPDGALYISDDLGGRIWRAVYDGGRGPDRARRE
jgi:glucose/arabinose dehydrogenase